MSAALMVVLGLAAAPYPLLPDRKPQTPFRDVAGMAEAGLIATQHTCSSEKSVTEICPGLSRNAGRVWDLSVPEGARWLFYGPSYMAEIFETVAAANDIVKVESLENVSLVSEMFGDEQNDIDRRDRLCDLPSDVSDELAKCNVNSASRDCTSELAYGVKRVTLHNGAVLLGIHNNALPQTEEDTSMRLLRTA